MTSFVPALLAKVTAVLALGLIAVFLMRAFAPSLRHVVLLATLGAALALPVVMTISPQWRVAILPAETSVSADPRSDAGGPVVLISSPSVTASTAPTAAVEAAPFGAGRADAGLRQASGPTRVLALVEEGPILPMAWLVGFIAVLGWMGLGRARLNQIARRSWALVDFEWSRTLDEERNEAGVEKHVRLLSSSDVSTPLTWGWRAPVILLPEDALEWSETHRRIVLRHELAHVARADSLAQLLAGVACAIYWFHPLVWVTERRMRAECERACDESVVSRGTPAAEYAAHLLEVARAARAFGASGFLSVAMARPSQLEGRLLAVLNESRRRASASRSSRLVAALMIGAMLLPLAAFKPVQRLRKAGVPALDRGPAVVNTYASPPANEIEPPTPVSPAPPAERVDSTFQLSVPAKNGGTLTLDLSTGGKIVVNSWDRAEVLVRASLRGRDWRRTKVTLTPENGSARLESFFTGNSNNQSSSHVFDIMVPRTYDLQVSSAGGSISLIGLNGTFTGHTGGGEIDIRNSTGEAQLKTGGGEIRVTGSRLNGSVSTGGGLVRIDAVTGDLEGHSGSGPVIVDDRVRVGGAGDVNIADPTGASSINASSAGGSASATSRKTTTTNIDGKTTTTFIGEPVGGAATVGRGALRISTAGGALTVPSAPDGARVTTGGGAIRVGPSGGDLYASTGGGPIDIGPARGSVSAHTGAGDVTIELEGASGHEVDVTSGRGEVVLVVPRDLNAVLELESAYTNNLGHKTKIVSDIPVQITETSNWDDRQGTPRRYVRARQTVGNGGPVIRVRTVNGDVLLRYKK